MPAAGRLRRTGERNHPGAIGRVVVEFNLFQIAYVLWSVRDELRNALWLTVKW